MKSLVELLKTVEAIAKEAKDWKQILKHLAGWLSKATTDEKGLVPKRGVYAPRSSEISILKDGLAKLEHATDEQKQAILDELLKSAQAERQRHEEQTRRDEETHKAQQSHAKQGNVREWIRMGVTALGGLAGIVLAFKKISR